MKLDDIVRLRGWSIEGSDLAGLPHPTAPAADDPEATESFPSGVVREGNRYIVGFAEIATFAVCFDTHTIAVIESAQETTADCITHLIYDHLAPRILAHGGHLVLHGAAVEIGGALAVFVGDTGAGKSTLSASLHRAGYRLLGDDAVVVTCEDGRFFGEPVYPSLRLYPDAVAALLGEATSVAPMAYYSDKQRVTLATAPGEPAQRVPLSTVFFLAGDLGAECPAAQKVPPADACIGLVNQSFLLDPADARIAATGLRDISALVGKVGAFSVRYPHDYSRLDEVHALILRCMGQDGTHREREARA
jgi:hypothetical protein